jgi:16S rRNA (guanine(1405)-N(7))-methyltransferase
MFQIPKNADDIKKEFLKKAKMGSLNEEDYEKALSLHLSTKERLSSYPIIYRKIFEMTGKPKIILDLGCGLNPLSVYHMNLKNFKFIASDIDKSNLDFIQRYFDLAGINGETVVLDLLNKDDLEKLSRIQCDVCFLFKVLEIDKRIAEPIFTKVNARFIVVSFSTLSLSGKIMSNSERQWFEKMLSRLKLQFETFKTENEIFYITEK